MSNLLYGQIEPTVRNSLIALVLDSMAELEDPATLHAYIIYGLNSEVGEVFDLAHKSLRKGYTVPQLDWMNELGDVLYWVTAGVITTPSEAHILETQLAVAMRLVKEGTPVLITDSELLTGCAMRVIQKLADRKAKNGSYLKRHDQKA